MNEATTEPLAEAPPVVLANPADDWDTIWADYGDSASENPAQAMRRRLVLRWLGARSGDRIVDLGSGQGDFARDLLDAVPGSELLGLELGASGIEQARLKSPNARFVQTNLLERQNPPADLRGWGTHATCTEVLEHLEDPSLFLRNASEYLAPGARMVITVPAGPRSAFDRFIGHRRHFTRSSLTTVIEGGGLRVERVIGAGFPFFNLYRLVVVARGERLIEDAKRGAENKAAGLAYRVFDALFRLNLDAIPAGWQLIAVATVPPA